MGETSIQVVVSQQVLDQTGLVLCPLGGLHGSQDSCYWPSDDLQLNCGRYAQFLAMDKQRVYEIFV